MIPAVGLAGKTVAKKAIGGRALGTAGKVMTGLTLLDTAKTGISGAARELKSPNRIYDDILNNRAEETLEQLVLEKQAGKNLTALKAGLQEGIRKLPIITAPLLASILINKNLKSDMSPMRPTNKELVQAIRYKLQTEGDVKTAAWQEAKDRLQKIAAGPTPVDVPKYLNAKPWKAFFKGSKKDIPAKMIFSVSELLPAAALTWAIGKNLRGRGETIPTRRPEYQRQKALRKYRDIEDKKSRE